MKTLLKFLTVLACAYVLVLGIAGLVRFELPSPLEWKTLVFSIVYFVAPIKNVMYITLSLLTLAKVFLCERTKMHKILAIVLAVSGLAQIIIMAVHYCASVTFSSNMISSFQDFRAIAGSVPHIVIALLMVLICVNVFFGFIKEKAAIIICACVFMLNIIFNFTIMFSHYHMLTNSGIILMISSSLLAGAIVFLVSYVSLRTNKGLDK